MRTLKRPKNLNQGETMFTPEQLKARRDARKAARHEAKEAARIEAEKNQRHVKEMTISIEWRKSRMWGNNPHAEVSTIYQNDGKGEYYAPSQVFTCGGCGYDKESTVIASAFNAFLKYKLWGKMKKYARWERRNHDGPNTNENYKRVFCHPYGISISKAFVGRDGKKYSEHRYFDGGIGTSCYTHDNGIAAAIGGKFEHIASGKTFDVYKYTDNL
jgi:hypothetical protein